MRKLLAILVAAALVGIQGAEPSVAAEASRLSHAVSILGPDHVKHGETCEYTAQVTGGSGTYTYEWSAGGVVLGSGATQFVTMPSSGNKIVIGVSVTDNGEVASALLFVATNSSGVLCGT